METVKAKIQALLDKVNGQLQSWDRIAPIPENPNFIDLSGHYLICKVIASRHKIDILKEIQDIEGNHREELGLIDSSKELKINRPPQDEKPKRGRKKA